MLPSPILSRRSGGEVRLKLESLQDTRAFKIRGAANAIKALPEAALKRGIVTYSTGNHGRAVAYVAAKLGIPATICVSEQVTPDKIEALQATGCRLRIEGRSQDEAAVMAFSLQEKEGLSVIDPINDPTIITGHGTVGLELLEDWPDLDTVVVPVSGGALICGIALALKSIKPDCRVIGVSMDQGAAMYASLQAGRPVLIDEVQSLADSLQGGILLDNKYTFQMVRRYVDDLVLVTEEQIAQAMAYAYLKERVVLEGAAATPIAALFCAGRTLFGKNVVLVNTGAAVDPLELLHIVQAHADSVEALVADRGGD